LPIFTGFSGFFREIPRNDEKWDFGEERINMVAWGWGFGIICL